jgi:hypothetical protein
VIDGPNQTKEVDDIVSWQTRFDEVCVLRVRACLCAIPRAC